MTLRFISKDTVSLGALLALGAFAKAPPFIASATAAENVVIAQLLLSTTRLWTERRSLLSSSIY